MATEVKLPRLGQGMESGTIVRWLKAKGDKVEKGEPLFEVDTDKATQEVEAEASGVLLLISVDSGDVPVGQTVAMIGEPGESVTIEAPAEEKEPASEAIALQEPAVPTQAGEAPKVEERSPAATGSGNVTHFRAAVNGAVEASGRVKASPLARRMARERGIELGALTGTGPEGRIVAEDVERHEGSVAAPVEGVAAAPTEAQLGEIESVPLSNIRRTIARRLTEAWMVPVFQLTVSIDMTQANTLIGRSRQLDPDLRVTVTDLLAKVCGRALMRHPDVNVQYTPDALLRFRSANIGLAVAAPQGLYVPVVGQVERLSLGEIAAARAALVDKARAGSLQLADLEGGTFTISNLGMFGVEQFSAILNPPQAAILAIGATVDRPVAQDGEVVIAPMMNVTLTVDHRAVDGAPAADFLRTVKLFLEDPALAL